MRGRERNLRARPSLRYSGVVQPLTATRPCAWCALAGRIVRKRTALLGEDVQLRTYFRRALFAQHPAHECRPPVVLLVEGAVRAERGPGLRMDLLRALTRLVAGDAFALQHPPADLRMQHLVRPIIVVEVRR